MKKNGKAKLKQAVLCLLCLTIVWRYGSSLEGTEFSGGRLTRSLLDMKDVGALLFFPALALTFFYRRIAAAVSIIACLLCLPLYLYFTTPGPFRWLFRGEYSVPLRASFVWNTWIIVGILVLAIATYFSLHTLVTPEDSKPRTSA
jgi:amino acid transporter